jgi:hypothetical protein
MGCSSSVFNTKVDTYIHTYMHTYIHTYTRAHARTHTHIFHRSTACIMVGYEICQKNKIDHICTKENSHVKHVSQQ